LVSEYWVIFVLFVSESGFLSQGFSTPFLSLGSSYMYTSLKEAKQAVLAVGEEIKNAGLPLGICPLIFVFTGTGNGKRYMQNTGKHAP
jgi:alpha-aminoadipic semialdehyde synthase